MALQTRLVIRPEQRLVMTAMLQQAIALLPMNRLELQQSVRQELLENPALEDSGDDVQEVADGEMPEVADDLPDPEKDERGDVEIDWENIVQDTTYSPNGAGSMGDAEDFPSYEQTLSRPETLQEHLEWQLNLTVAPAAILQVARLIVGNIDDSGYFRTDLTEFAAQEGLDPEEVAEALSLVQEFDPPGVGARDLRECLLLQIRHLTEIESLEADFIRLAEALVDRNIENLEERHFPKLARSHGVSIEEIGAAIRVIRALDPRPGSSFSSQQVEVAIPDVIVTKNGDDFDIVLTDDGLPPLRVSHSFGAMAADREATPPEARRYIEERVRAAVWFLKSIEQRRQTTLKVARSIVNFQREFILKGVSHLRPLVLRDVAEDIGMHESTVSRVTTGKYMETPQGVLGFKYFFHSGLVSVNGGSAASVAVKEKICSLIDAEPKIKPFTDQQVVEKLGEDGVVIARRTVTKYRKELRLPPASRRRKLI